MLSVDMDDISNAGNSMTGESALSFAVDAPEDDWDHHHDESTGRLYFSNRLSGKVVWNIPSDDGGDGGEDNGEDNGGDDGGDGEGNRDKNTRRHTGESTWHSHEDEVSGKTYYEHRLSGKVVWDIPGVNTDADAGPSMGVDDVYEGGTATWKDHGEVGVELGGDPWSKMYDEMSGHWYHHNAVTGEAVWMEEVKEEEGEEHAEGHVGRGGGSDDGFYACS
jgi:hypothetical protein